MSEVLDRNILHDIAMGLIEEAQKSAQRGDASVAACGRRLAFVYELEAARLWPRTDPERAEVFLSAARLAMAANLPDEAMRVVHEGLICLDGLVPASTAEALFAVLAEAAPSP